jgi:alpha-amylase/alpha-mannosidase (GH57 family)
MAEVAVAFLWHQHQPYYRDDVAGETALPWVRLHGVRDYLGMALLLEECPEMRCTFNLTPCLVGQLQAYEGPDGGDRCLDASRLPADGLTESDALFLLDHFFLANPARLILPHPRYAELYRLRNADQASAHVALARFRPQDLLDLQVWFNLAWIHPLAVEGNACLRQLSEQGRQFTEDDKAALLDQQLNLLAGVLPCYQRLAESGQIELTTSPFYHPILPLLLDKRIARESQPEARLPQYDLGYPEDVSAQWLRAVALHTDIFNKPPHGCWPPEGAVSADLVPLLTGHGFRWFAADEVILRRSTNGAVGRDGRGFVQNPEGLYRPYRIGGTEALSAVFRDHALSDLITFQYPHSEPEAAAEAFVRRLLELGQSVPGPGPALVAIVLDGETCGDQYPGGGVAFLRALYRRCTTTPGVRPVTVDTFLQQHPPTEVLPQLSSGSWIDGDFSVWVGHEEDNTAWDALHRTRAHLVERIDHWRAAACLGGGAAAQLPHRLRRRLDRAWEEVYIAEGSDWFGWYGDAAVRPEETLFDELFRKHLRNVYLVLGDVPPADLATPIRRQALRSLFTPPRALLDVQINGRVAFFEWVGAGHFTCADQRGPAQPGPLREIYFGSDLRRLLVRMDCAGPAHTTLAEADCLRLVFVEPAGVEVRLRRPGQPDMAVELVRPEGTTAAGLEAAVDLVVELAVPFDSLGVAVGQGVRFSVEVLAEGQALDRAPREGTLAMTRPSEDFERSMWDV